MPDSQYQGKIVINEIHHSSNESDTKYEFFELFNTSDEPINISGWYFVCDGSIVDNSPDDTDGDGVVNSITGFCDKGQAWVIPGNTQPHPPFNNEELYKNTCGHPVPDTTPSVSGCTDRTAEEDGISVDGAGNIILGPGEYILFERHGGTYTSNTYRKYGSFGRGSLKYRGHITSKTILDLRDANGDQVDYVNYCLKSGPDCDDMEPGNDYWGGLEYTAGTFNGHTLELINPKADNSRRGAWQKSFIGPDSGTESGVGDEQGGSPGGINSTFTIPYEASLYYGTEVPLSCMEGCTNPDAENYYCNLCAAGSVDGICDYICEYCFGESDIGNWTGYNTLPQFVSDDGSCIGIYGCTNSNACNYNIGADVDDGSCIYAEECYNCPEPYGDGACNCELDACGICGGSGILVNCYEDLDGNDIGNSEVFIEVCVETPIDDPVSSDYCPDNYSLNSDPNCISGVYDCLGTCDGSAVIDDCGVCDGNGIPEGYCDCDTEPEENYDCDGNCLLDVDCAGVCGGDAQEDLCGVCNGFNDCLGCTDDAACNYDGSVDDGWIDDESCIYPDDEFYDCDGNCIVDIDCTGLCGGENVVDECGVCTGPDTEFEFQYEGNCTMCDADGLPGEEYQADCAGNCPPEVDFDECGVCGGDGIVDGECDCDGNILDCAGECGGDAVVDECGICGGEGAIYGDNNCCQDEVDPCGVCNGENDCSADGIAYGDCTCAGCMDENSNNYNSDAIFDDGSCQYTEGCTNPNSANYVPSANEDNGQCDVVILGYVPCVCINNGGWIPDTSDEQPLQFCPDDTATCDDNGYCECNFEDESSYVFGGFTLETDEDTSINIKESLFNSSRIYNPYNPGEIGDVLWTKSSTQWSQEGVGEYYLDGDDLHFINYVNDNLDTIIGTLSDDLVFNPANNVSGIFYIHIDVQNINSGGPTEYQQIPVKVFVNPIEDPFYFDEDSFPDKLTLLTDDSDVYPTYTIQLTDEEWGNLSDPEYNYEVSLQFRNDIDETYAPYLTWNIFGSTIQLSPNFGFYGKISLTLHISDPSGIGPVAKSFDVFINLVEENESCIQSHPIEHIDGSTDNYCIYHNHNSSQTFPGISRESFRSGLNSPSGVTHVDTVNSITGLYSNYYNFVITSATDYLNNFGYGSVDYNYRIFSCETDSCVNPQPMTISWENFTYNPNLGDDPTGSSPDSVAWTQYLFMNNGRYMFVTEAVDKYDNYHYKKVIFSVNRVVDINQFVTNKYLPWQGINIPTDVEPGSPGTYTVYNKTEVELQDIDTRKSLGIFHWDDQNFYNDWGMVLDSHPNTFSCDDEDGGYGCFKDCFTEYEGDTDGCLGDGLCEYSGVCSNLLFLNSGLKGFGHPQYWFTPDVDVRTTHSFANSLDVPLNRYWDKNLNPEEYYSATAPAEVQFYFYPRESYYSSQMYNEEGGNMFKYRNYHEDLNSVEYGINKYFIAFMDFGDGSDIEFTDEPHRCGEPIVHGYEDSGIYTITGFMFRYRGEVEDSVTACWITLDGGYQYYEYDVTQDWCDWFRDEPGVVATEFITDYLLEAENKVTYFQKFEITIKLQKRVGFEDEFRIIGGNDYTFLPYDYTSPMIGGISENSLYSKGLQREVGWFGDDFQLEYLYFTYYKDKLKSEFAYAQLDDSKVSSELLKYHDEVNDLSVQNPYGMSYQGPGSDQCGECEIVNGVYDCPTAMCFESNNTDCCILPDNDSQDGNLIYTGEYNDFYGEFGNYFGNADIGQVKLFSTGVLSMEEMLGFRNEPLEESYGIIEGAGSVLLSAPHGCMTFRNTINADHVPDDNTGAIAITLGEITGAHVIYQKYATDDANFYHYIPGCQGNEAYCTPAYEGYEGELLPYKKALKEYLEQHPEIKLVIDVHGANWKRFFAVDLGLRGPRNIPPDIPGGAWGDTTYPYYGLHDILENPEEYAPSLKTDWGKQELLPLLVDIFSEPEPFDDSFVGLEISDWPTSYCDCDTWDPAMFNMDSSEGDIHWGWVDADGFEPTGQSECGMLPECTWINNINRKVDLDGDGVDETTVGGITFNRYFTAAKRPGITNFITREDESEDEYLYAGPRGWLGNVDCIQLEWSREYRNFEPDTYGVINTAAGVTQLKKVSQLINAVNEHYKNEGVLPADFQTRYPEDDSFNNEKYRVHEIQDSIFSDIIYRTLDDTVLEEIHSGNPNSDRYWKNIIPKDYSIDNRLGLFTEYNLTPNGHHELYGFQICTDNTPPGEYCIPSEYVVSFTLPQTFDMFYRYVTGVPDEYTRRSSVTLENSTNFQGDVSVDGDATSLGGTQGSYSFNFETGEFLLEYGSGTEYRGKMDWTTGAIPATITEGEFEGLPCWQYPESIVNGVCNATLTRFDGTKGWFEIDYLSFGQEGTQTTSFQSTASVIRTDNTIYWDLPDVNLQTEEAEEFFNFFGGENNIITIIGPNNTSLQTQLFDGLIESIQSPDFTPEELAIQYPYLDIDGNGILNVADITALVAQLNQPLNVIEQGKYYIVVVKQPVDVLLPFNNYDLNGIVKNITIDEDSPQEWLPISKHYYINEDVDEETGLLIGESLIEDYLTYPYYPALPKLKRNGTFNTNNVLQGHSPSFGQYPNITLGTSNNRPFGSPGRDWDEDDKTSSVTNDTYKTNLIGLGEEKVLLDLDFSGISTQDSLEDISGNRNIGLVITDYKLDYNENRTPKSIKGRFKTLIGKDKDGKVY